MSGDSRAVESPTASDARQRPARRRRRAPTRSRPPGATSSRARARRRAHPAARDFLHRDLQEALRAPDPGRRVGARGRAAARAICWRRCPTRARMGIDYLPEIVERRAPATRTSPSRSATRPRAAGARWRRPLPGALGTRSSATGSATACSTSRRCCAGSSAAGAGRAHLPDRVQLPVGGAGAPGGAGRLEAPGARPRTGCPTPTSATCSTSPGSRWCATRTACSCRSTCRALSTALNRYLVRAPGDAVAVALPDLRAARPRRRGRAARRASVSVIVPTRNEAGNVAGGASTARR